MRRKGGDGHFLSAYLVTGRVADVFTQGSVALWLNGARLNIPVAASVWQKMLFHKRQIKGCWAPKTNKSSTGRWRGLSSRESHQHRARLTGAPGNQGKAWTQRAGGESQPSRGLDSKQSVQDRQYRGNKMIF